MNIIIIIEQLELCYIAVILLTSKCLIFNFFVQSGPAVEYARSTVQSSVDENRSLHRRNRHGVHSRPTEQQVNPPKGIQLNIQLLYQINILLL